MPRWSSEPFYTILAYRGQCTTSHEASIKFTRLALVSSVEGGDLIIPQTGFSLPYTTMQIHTVIQFDLGFVNLWGSILIVY